MRVVRQHGSLVSERLAYVSCPSVVAVEAPKVRLARLCPVVACSRRRRSSWRKLNAWIGVIEVRARRPSYTRHPNPTRTSLHQVTAPRPQNTLQMGDGDSWNFRIHSPSLFIICPPTMHSSSHQPFVGTVKYDPNCGPYPRSNPIGTSRSHLLLPYRLRPRHSSADRERH